MPPVVLGIDEQAFRIVGIRGRGAGHPTKSVVAEQLLGMLEPVDVDEERRQITGRRNPAAVRIHPGDVHSIGITPRPIVVFHFVGRPVFQRVSGNPHIG